MSNSEALVTIETTDLAQVSGATKIQGSVAVTTPVRGGATVSGSYESTNYEACIAAARRTASEAYPDRRNPWEHLIGAPDVNARQRASYERDGIRACATPPQG